VKDMSFTDSPLLLRARGQKGETQFLHGETAFSVKLVILVRRRRRGRRTDTGRLRLKLSQGASLKPDESEAAPKSPNL
jgi:hypothetical protein